MKTVAVGKLKFPDFPLVITSSEENFIKNKVEALILLTWNDPKNKFISVFEAVYLNYQNTSQMCYFGMWICHRGSLSFLNDQYSVVNMYKTTQNIDFADPSLQIPP